MRLGDMQGEAERALARLRTIPMAAWMESPLHVTPFSIQIDAEVLSDLRERIRNTRWPDQAPGPAWEQGTDLEYLRRVLAYWADEFDWRARERELNAANQFRAGLDGVHIHFVHERARGGHGIPL